jgi:Cu2+-exporting ATPase
MTCCAPPAEAIFAVDASRRSASGADEILFASKDLGDGTRQTDLSVPGVHCGACIASVEKSVSALPGVESARVNLSTKRLAIKWRAADGASPDLIGALRAAGYEAHLFSTESDAPDPKYSRLIRALAVAGFCAMNIMLLSVSVWAGADGGTRQAFHWISAGLALPAILYSGRIFYSSAWIALRHGRTNMDVPISIGVLLAFALSLYDTFQNGRHAYFDAATSLLFFLLIGRVLDQVMRERARSAVAGLARLAPRGATVVHADGQRTYAPISQIEPGMTFLVAAGNRIPVDGLVATGTSELDCSLVSGESALKLAGPGTPVQAGLMNLTGPLTVRASARAENSFLAEMVRMMEVAEGGRARYRRLADRASALYSPIVHAIALLSFLGWISATGDWHSSITIAIAVLIVTCPCALGLAVPIVQVVAARRLFEKGIMVKDGTALERLAEIDTVLFDKTGTLTLGKPCLVHPVEIAPEYLKIAAEIAVHSSHPIAASIAAAGVAEKIQVPKFDKVKEYPGLGLEAGSGDVLYRLGQPVWALAANEKHCASGTASVSALTRNGELLATFTLEDRIRPGARQSVQDLVEQGLTVEILSGDHHEAVEGLALRIGVARFLSGLLPSEKLTRIRELSKAGRKMMMVGDGLNDAPALAAAYVSMAPATAADIGRNSADFVFLNENLSAVTDALEISRSAKALVGQNFALAIGYNAIAVPIAVLGYVTPLVAAVAMSLSSVLVVANALRLGHSRRNVWFTPSAAPYRAALQPGRRAS